MLLQGICGHLIFFEPSIDIRRKLPSQKRGLQGELAKIRAYVAGQMLEFVLNPNAALRGSRIEHPGYGHNKVERQAQG
ncbi:hypothetical protein SDC9_135140 [bioreactor metagenome]|uniref:Uncharacterized protein n=1 Tax=bioreactor metagenome TaxID=1076179 RepID=A0A645DFJ2_9ZZZZ